MVTHKIHRHNIFFGPASTSLHVSAIDRFAPRITGGNGRNKMLNFGRQRKSFLFLRASGYCFSH